MTITKRALVPFALLVAFLFVAWLILSNPPTANRKPPSSKPQLSVETLALMPRAYPVVINSYGTVKPRIESQLVAQVSGQIVEVSAQFRNGGFFEKGDLLVRIDDRDYQAEVSIASAALSSAQQMLAEEQARSQQALEDWLRLGNTTQAPDLVLRKPQLEAARAQVASAQAALSKVKLSLERTRIVAPFSGRVLSKQVDVGQVVSMNGTLASIYATDFVEIRLPLKNRDLDFIALPENYRFEAGDAATSIEVTIQSHLISAQEWRGEIVRTEGAIDDASRQLHVVAQIEDPYGVKASGRQPLKIGEYVTAKVQGRVLQDAIVIPNASIYQGSYVYLVVDELLQRREIEILWQNQDEAIIGQGLVAGDQLVLTPLGQVASGVRVRMMQPQTEAAQQELARSAAQEDAP